MRVNKILLLSGAALALTMSPAFAQSGGKGYPSGPSKITFSKEYTEDVHVNATNDVAVKLKKEIEVTKELHFYGHVDIDGKIRDINAASFAVIDNKQINLENYVYMPWEYKQGSSNSAGTDSKSSVLNGASGNIGVNMAAGAYNLQDNAAAIASTQIGPSGYKGGAASADAEIFTIQKAHGNITGPAADYGKWNAPTSDNTASLLGAVLNGASGNIGVNVAAGSFNAQQNSLAIANVQGTAVLAEATAAVLQENTRNYAQNVRFTNSATIGGKALDHASGNIGVNMAAGVSNLQNNSLSLSATSTR